MAYNYCFYCIFLKFMNQNLSNQNPSGGRGEKYFEKLSIIYINIFKTFDYVLEFFILI